MYYRRLIRDARLAINGNGMSRECAGIFCHDMRVLIEILMACSLPCLFAFTIADKKTEI